MSEERYPEEELDSVWEDCGVMPENVDTLRESVVGRRIVSAKKEQVSSSWYGRQDALVLTLDDNTQVTLVDTDDCCAFTVLYAFLLDPSSVDHIITGVGTTDNYSVWHIYADYGDILKLQVGWSCGNPFYYGYGFDITVTPVDNG